MKLSNLILQASIMSACLLPLATTGQPVPELRQRIFMDAKPLAEDGTTLRYSTAPKVSQTLRERATREQTLSVFVVLSDQPQREIYRRIEGANRLRLEIAEGRYDETVRKPFPDARHLAQVREDFDAVIVETRQQAAKETQARIRPQQDAMEEHLKSLGATRIGRYVFTNMLRADIPSSALAVLEGDPRIQEVAAIEKHELELDISVPALGAPAFWNAGFAGVGESVAVLDSGVYAGHPAFAGKVLGKTFVANNPACSPQERDSTLDFNGHGTHVAGIIASQGTQQFPQFLGVAKGLTTIYNAKVSCGAGESFTDDMLLATEAVLAETFAGIVNNSNGGPAIEDDDFFSRKIDEYVDTYSDLLWVNSAGNRGPTERKVTTPGTAYNIISVANWDTRGTVSRSDDIISQSSSRGSTMGGRFKPDIAAPGTNIYSTDYLSNGFVRMSGTSMAAPHIAGAAALLRHLGLRERMSIKALLINTTDNFGWQPDSGWGYANLNRALAQARNVISGGALGTVAGSFRLYRGTASSSENLSATLVWNRFVSGATTFLRNLDLHLYKRETNTLIAESTLRPQNVEQVGAKAGAGNVVFKVRAGDAGRGFTEPFALAVSSPGFSLATGPVLDVACSGPSPVPPNTSFSVTCTASNTGDLEAFDLTGSLAVVGGTAGTSQAFGTVGPQGSVSRTFSVTSPGGSGSFGLRADLGSLSYGERFAVSKVFTVQLSGPQACTFSLNPTSRTLSSSPGTGTVTVTTASGCAWSAVSNASWITVTSGASGTGSGTVGYSVAANPATTSRTGTLTIAGQTFTVTQSGATDNRPSIAQNGVVNGASFQPGISQGSWGTIRGRNFGSTTRIWRPEEIVNGRLPTQLDGVSVNVNGKPAYVYFISPEQINVQAPSDESLGDVPVEVVVNGVRSDPVMARLQKFSPGFFLWIGKYVVATDPSFNWRVKPGTFAGVNTTAAKPGDVIILWGTGFGLTSPQIPAGQTVDKPTTLVEPVRVTIGGLTAEYLGGALSPGSAGLYQIAVRVPEAAPNGDLPVVAEVGGFRSQDNAFLTVQK
ncbi:MAG: S8 family serine peptidase [Acidobacteriota bacterium]